MDRELTGETKGTEQVNATEQGNGTEQVNGIEQAKDEKWSGMSGWNAQERILTAPPRDVMEPKVTEGQGWVAWLMLAVGFCYMEWIFVVQAGLGVLLFAILFCGVAACYMKQNGFVQTKSSLFYLGVVGLSALNFILFDNEPIRSLNLMFLTCMAVYWICTSTGRRINGDLSGYVIGDFVNQAILVPFGNFGREFAALFGSLQRKKEINQQKKEEKSSRRKNLLLAAAGLLMMLPLLILVINLLTAADQVFADFISRIDLSIHFSLPENWLPYVLEFIAGIPVACYLFGLLYGNVAGRGTDVITKKSFDKAAEGARIMPKVMVCTAVGALIFIYLLFFATQAAYLFSAFQDSLPVTMTYAEYARRGFFELCTVAGINLVVIAASNLLAAGDKNQQKAEAPETTGKSTRPAALRIETAVLCGLTMMLIATAVSKMVLYIEYYGLTQLRFYTTAFMVLMFVCFVIILLRQLRVFNCGKWLALACVIGFLAMAYSNADGIIANYNIGRYEEGTLETVDVAALGNLSDAAVEPLCRLFQETDDEQMKWQIYMALMGEGQYGVSTSMRQSNYREWNYQSWKAKQVLADMKWGDDMAKQLEEYQVMMENAGGADYID